MRKILLYVGGAISFVYVIVHLSFWKMFNWTEELARLSTMNEGLMQMLCIGVTYLFVFAAIISVYLARLKEFRFIEKAVICFIAGIYLLRFGFGFPLFGFTMLELINATICLLGASCYLLSLYNYNSAEQ